MKHYTLKAWWTHSIPVCLKTLSLQNCRIVSPEPSLSADFTDTILMFFIQKEEQHKVTGIQMLSHFITR